MTITRRRLLILITTIVGSSVVFLDGTVVNLALPKIAQTLGIGFAGQQWIIDGYLLSLSALILLGGSLGDIFGHKKSYAIGLIGFSITSALCVIPNAQILIAMRILHGVFGALLVPGSLALINTNIPLQQRGKAFGQWTAATSAVTAFGPLLGGLLVDKVGWQWVFVLPIPFAVVALILLLGSTKNVVSATKRKLDLMGASLAMVSLSLIIYGLIQGPTEHWSRQIIFCLLVGSSLFVSFIITESKRKDPMLNVHLFRSVNFTAANVSTFALYGALGGLSFIMLIYLQETLHYSSLAAGATFLPIAILLVTLSSKFGALSSKYGPRLFMGVGPIVCAAGMALLLPLSAGSSFVTGILPGITLFALGLAITVAPLTTTVMTSVAEKDSGIASAINNAVSRAAGLIVIALLGVFGTTHIYRNSILLCSLLAIGAGILSLLFVQNKRRETA